MILGDHIFFEQYGKCTETVGRMEGKRKRGKQEERRQKKTKEK